MQRQYLPNGSYYEFELRTRFEDSPEAGETQGMYLDLVCVDKDGTRRTGVTIRLDVPDEVVKFMREGASLA